MLCAKVKIISNKQTSQKYFKIRLTAPSLAKEALPGQFVMAKISNDYEPLLRRPFSIHRVTGKNIEIIYEIKGKGTQILSHKKPGEYLDVIGPLGNGFDYCIPYPVSRIPILVAGGMGVAPLVFLAEKLKELNTRYSIRNTVVLMGARTKSQLSCEKEFKGFGCDVKIATDDGSAGFKGRITELLERILRTPYPVPRTPLLYACGPKPMLKEVIRVAGRYNIPAQVSLEEYMACGFGACLGCVVQTKNGYKRVCKEGPVFSAQELSL